MSVNGFDSREQKYPQMVHALIELVKQLTNIGSHDLLVRATVVAASTVAVVAMAVAITAAAEAIAVWRKRERVTHLRICFSLTKANVHCQ